jgi:hypothetical protein
MSRAGNAETSSNTKRQSKVIKAVPFLYLHEPGTVCQLKGSQHSCYCQPMEGNVTNNFSCYRQPMEGKVKAYLMLWHQLTVS